MRAHDTVCDEAWLKTLPYARMVYPESLWNQVKYGFWSVYTPYHPLVRDTALALCIVRHEGRQGYLLGRVAPHLTIKEFILFLTERGYGNHFVAWEDEGELASLRYVEDFSCQYHVRVFEDGEVRAHFEYTPECYPLSHMLDIGMEERRGYFLELLGNTLVEGPVLTA